MGGGKLFTKLVQWIVGLCILSAFGFFVGAAFNGFDGEKKFADAVAHAEDIQVLSPSPVTLQTLSPVLTLPGSHGGKVGAVVARLDREGQEKNHDLVRSVLVVPYREIAVGSKVSALMVRQPAHPGYSYLLIATD